MKTLVLFTGSYPYSAAAENTFVPQELAVLHRHFDRILLVPGSVDGNREPIDLPNVTVDTGFATYAGSMAAKWRRLVLGLADPELLRECLSHRSLFRRYPSALRRAIGYYVQSKMAESWIRRVHAAKQLPVDRTILYTWWFDAPTLGLARFGEETGIRVITRAHGYDVYEARHSPPYIPFRLAALEKVDRVYPDSDAGARYLAEMYPLHAHKVEPALLGVEDPGFITVGSTDGVLRIVSCSFLSPVKRIDLLIQGLTTLAAELPSMCISWTHIGDGPEKPKLAAQAAATLPTNVQWALSGYPGKDGLYEYYRSNPVDLFVNVSESEGTPVSLMEAISVGIPVLCTSVGGNIEVVGNGNGMLISANPSPKEIADGIRAISGNPEELPGRKSASRSRWQERYNAQKNYSGFAESIQGSAGDSGWRKRHTGM